MELFKNIRTKTLVFSNEYLNNIMKIVQSIEDASLLMKDIPERVENEVKEQKGGFLGMLNATLGASLLSSILVGNGIIRASEGAIVTSQGRGTVRAAEGTIRADQDF